MYRKAVIADIPKISLLVNTYASSEEMLPRPMMELLENIRDFWVCIDDSSNELIGCCALSIETAEMAEIKCLAVEKEHQLKGIGSELVRLCIEEVKSFGIKKVFALTKRPEFFKKLSFKTINRNKLPHKIWTECVRCMKFPECDETAVVYEIENAVKKPAPQADTRAHASHQIISNEVKVKD
ncbi:MAG: N-acetyltransferase [Candidatus Hydrogenedentota bacterium]